MHLVVTFSQTVSDQIIYTVGQWVREKLIFMLSKNNTFFLITQINSITFFLSSSSKSQIDIYGYKEKPSEKSIKSDLWGN